MIPKSASRPSGKDHARNTLHAEPNLKRTPLDRLFDSAARAPRNLGRGLITVYRYSLSPLVGLECRHLPTCSQYADEAIERFGLWAGGWMTAGRLCRCHPFGTSGLDFVPKEAPPGARWFLPWRYARWRGTNTAP